jgi:hypothetical protein
MSNFVMTLFLAAFRRQKRICRNQLILLERMEQMGLSLDALKALALQIDDAIKVVEAKVQDLSDQVANNTVTPADVSAALQPELDKLVALGQPPAPPVG